jgi:endosialidase-like protein
VALYKNGSAYDYGTYSGSRSVVSDVIDLNGTTDYVEAYVYNAGGTTILGDPAQTRFTGALTTFGNGLANENTTISGTFKVSTTAQTSSNPSLYVSSSGSVGIGTSSPNARLQVTGGSVLINTTGHVIGSKLQITFDGSAEQGITIKNSVGSAAGAAIRFIDSGDAASGGGIYFTSSNGITYATTSDRRLKENILPTGEGLAKLMEIPVTDFNFTSDPSKTTMQGFIAQDLYKVYPAAVHVGGDDAAKNPWGVDYGRLTPLIVKSVQELKTANDNLVSETEALRKSREADGIVHKREMRDLRAELKAANDNHVKEAEAVEELRKELQELKKGAGFRRVVGR